MRWVIPTIYAVVFGGTVVHAALGGPLTVAFVAGMAALAGLEFVADRLPPRLVFAARVVLIVAVAVVDESGLARALFVVVPFTAYFVFGRLAAVGSALACIATAIARVATATPSWYRDPESISDVLMLSLGLLLAVSMAATAVEERNSRRLLEVYARQVGELTAAQERNRLARDIHDSLGHHLTAVAVQLEKAQAFADVDRDTADQAIRDARWSALRALDEVRESVSSLREHSGTFSLTGALDELVRRMDSTSLAVSLVACGDEKRYPPTALRELFRAAQEGLTNAARHAHASHVQVRVDYGAVQAQLVVADNGVGMRSGTGRGFGLRGMRERVELLGGHLDVASPGTGTTVTVVVPAQ